MYLSTQQAFKSLALIFFLGLLVNSCAGPTKLLSSSKKGKKVVLSEKNFKPIFKGDFKSFLFKTKMAYGDKFEIGGMLLLKQTSVGNYRTIFMTKFGMTLFDFEFGDKGFIVHKVFEQMNKKIFLKIIEQDIEMLLTRHILGTKAMIYEKEAAPKKRLLIKAKMNKKMHYFVQEKQQRITEIHRGKAVSIHLSKFIAKIPRSIDIQHHNIPLSMQLTLLKH